VYIGHPGWKAMGARRGYSFATGIATLLVCFITIIPVLMAIIPIEALLPILVYVALIMGSQAFQESPKEHAPAIFLALVPWLSNWVVTSIDNTLLAAGTNAWADGMIQKLLNSNIVYMGLLTLNQGAVILSMLFGMLGVFIIDRKTRNAGCTAISLAILSFFGFVHGQNIGINVNQNMSIGYLIMAAVIFAVGFYNDYLEKKTGPAVKR
jgi:AGZA family xanthine/uracil permease-like MFS transporter